MKAKTANNPKSGSAENSEKAARLVRYRFQPGQSGNPGGRPRKKPITELYEEILADTEIVAAIRRAIVKTITGSNLAAVLQLKELADRVEGKVTQQVEVDGKLVIHSLAERMQKARERADQQRQR